LGRGSRYHGRQAQPGASRKRKELNFLFKAGGKNSGCTDAVRVAEHHNKKKRKKVKDTDMRFLV
jgi:hypothetical protein